MAPYARVISVDGLIDEAALSAMEAKNKEELEKFDTKLKEIEETEGETEISEALRARASYLTRIGDKVSSLGGLFACGTHLCVVIGTLGRGAKASFGEDSRLGRAH